MLGSTALLHKSIWKFVIMEFTRASKEGSQMQTDTIWKRATRRLATRVNAQGRKVQRRNLGSYRWKDGEHRKLMEQTQQKIRTSSPGEYIFWTNILARL